MVSLSLLGSANAQDEREELAARLDSLDNAVATATWIQTSREWSNEEEEYTRARCTWNGQNSLRLDISDGRGKGSAAILFENRVYGFKRGLLSFVKLDYPLRHKKVLSLLGHDMSSNGYFDDLRYLRSRWDRTDVVPADTGWVITYPDSLGRRTVLRLRESPLHVSDHEVFEGERRIIHYQYADVVYNAGIDEGRLRP